jgi:putative tryptophan/tyrosine transport system substrate-binding protein
MTGGAILSAELEPKRVELLHELVPAATDIALLVNTTNPTASTEEARMVQEACRSLCLQLHVLSASSASGIEDAFRTVVALRVGALVVHVDPFLTNQFAQIVALAARHAVPAIYGWPEAPVVGGLMGYGPRITDTYNWRGSMRAAFSRARRRPTCRSNRRQKSS